MALYTRSRYKFAFAWISPFGTKRKACVFLLTSYCNTHMQLSTLYVKTTKRRHNCTGDFGVKLLSTPET